MTFYLMINIVAESLFLLNFKLAKLYILNPKLF